MIDAFFDVAPKAFTLALIFGLALVVLKLDERRIRRDETRRVVRSFAGNRIPLGDPDAVTVGQLRDLERAYRIQNPQFATTPRCEIGRSAEVSALASAGEVPDARASDLT